MNFLSKILLGLFFALSLSCAHAQVKVPKAVTDAFAAKFPEATNVKWEKEGGDDEEENEYEAEFKQGGTEVSANFSKIGAWLETETEISETALPTAVLAAFHAKYGASTSVKEAAKIVKSTGKVMYEIEFKNDSKKKQEAIFDEMGSIVK